MSSPSPNVSPRVGCTDLEPDSDTIIGLGWGWMIWVKHLLVLVSLRRRGSYVRLDATTITGTGAG